MLNSPAASTISPPANGLGLFARVGPAVCQRNHYELKWSSMRFLAHRKGLVAPRTILAQATSSSSMKLGERMLRISGSRAHVLLDLWIASSLDRELSVWSNFQSSSERTYEHKSSPSCHSKRVSWRLFMGGYSNIPLSRFRRSCKSPKSDFLLMGKSESELRKARWNRDPRSAPDTHRQVIHCLHVLSTGRQSQDCFVLSIVPESNVTSDQCLLKLIQ